MPSAVTDLRTHRAEQWLRAIGLGPGELKRAWYLLLVKYRGDYEIVSWYLPLTFEVEARVAVELHRLGLIDITGWWIERRDKVTLRLLPSPLCLADLPAV